MKNLLLVTLLALGLGLAACGQSTAAGPEASLSKVVFFVK